MSLPTLPAPYTENFQPNLMAALEAWRLGIESKAAGSHTHGEASIVISIVASQANLGAGSTLGESKITADTGHRWVWQAPGVWVDLDVQEEIGTSILGGDVTVSGNVLTFTPCRCKDSTYTTVLETTANVQVTLPGTVNQDFYPFIVRLVADQSVTMKAYPAIDGPNSDGQVDKYRLISYAKNNGAGVTMPYRQVGDRIDWFSQSNRPVLTASLTASYVSYSIAALLPVPIKEGIITPSTAAIGVYWSYDGVTDSGYTASWDQISILPVSEIFLKYGATAAIHFISATLRR